MVGVHMVFAVERIGPHGGFDGVPHVHRACSNDRMFAIRFVPNGSDGRSNGASLNDGAHLRPRLTTEPITDAHAIFGQLHDFLL